jgi:lipopolysaccharide transport system permease protein
MTSAAENQHWTPVITSEHKLLHVPLQELWEYRELIMRLVHRDFVSRYKQTVLGSAWYVIQPLFTSLMFALVFNRIAGISTGEIPPILFFLAGTVCWGYFSGCVTNTASTFISNGSLFDKVYFSRLVVPISQLIVNLIGFGMQMVLFFLFYFYYLSLRAGISMGWRIIVLPMLLLQMAALGLGVGCIVSAAGRRGWIPELTSPSWRLPILSGRSNIVRVCALPVWRRSVCRWDFWTKRLLSGLWNRWVSPAMAPTFAVFSVAAGADTT